MELTIYASKKTMNKDGEVKQFYVYSTKIKNKKTEEEEFFNVKFRDECGSPSGAKCPMNIVVKKENANITNKTRKYTDPETGEEKEALNKTIWVTKWIEGNPFVDTSTDEYWCD